MIQFLHKGTVMEHFLSKGLGVERLNNRSTTVTFTKDSFDSRYFSKSNGYQTTKGPVIERSGTGL